MGTRKGAVIAGSCCIDDGVMIAAVKVVWKPGSTLGHSPGGGLNGSLLGQGSTAWDPIFPRVWVLGFPALVSLNLRDGP